MAITAMNHITLHRDLIQGSEEWLSARCGLLTASEIKLIMTPTLKPASNDKERAHLFELLAQRITRYVEPHFVTDDMLRGHADEIEARKLYAEKYSLVSTDVGFVTNSKWGFTLGYSPDGMVGDDGLIEIKSRRQKYQVQTLVDGAVPAEYMLQLQTGLLVTERQWVDFISYCGGLPMFVLRVFPDPKIQDAIIQTAGEFETRLAAKLWAYDMAKAFFHPTERRVEQEMFVGE
jgi:predicted phage-related endonuclease